jgi:hypothetical protein
MKKEKEEGKMIIAIGLIGMVIIMFLSVTLAGQKEAEREITTYSDASEGEDFSSPSSSGNYSSGSYLSSPDDMEEDDDLDGSYDEDSGDY